MNIFLLKMDFIDKALAQYDLDVNEATIPTIYNNTESILYPAPHQEMLELYTSFSEHDRMLAVWSTGSGKTIGSFALQEVHRRNCKKRLQC